MNSGPRSIPRSAWALLAGLFAGVILSLGTDEVLHLVRVYPPWGESMSDALFALATAYRAIYSAASCYIAARLASHRPMWHALVLGVAGVFLSGLGAAATWNREPPLGPHWYSLALIALAMPCAWLGGRLREIQLGEQ